MITVTVYFHGPQTDWGSQIAEREIIARHNLPFLWMARLKVKALFDELNAGRCGYVLMRGDTVIEKREAKSTRLATIPLLIE